MKELIRFQADHKYLFMAYNQNQLRTLGQIVANRDGKEFNEISEAYRKHLGLILADPPQRGNFINALMHILGYFSEDLSAKEKEFILDRLDKYREDQVHLSVVTNILQSYAIQYKKDYLLNQIIWETYPEDLLDLSDSGKRDLAK